MNTSKLFSDDFKPAPYWWDGVETPVVQQETPPQSAEVLIIGSGYTGLQAAIQTARAGRDTVVIDAERAGWGCSTRNGGQISTSVKPSYQKLKKQYGKELTNRILHEDQSALDYIEAFVAKEQVACDFRKVGGFHAAHSARQYELLARECEEQLTASGEKSFVVPKEEQARELGTEFFHGGMVEPNDASIDPAKYHAGLLCLAIKVGVKIISNCAALDIQRTKQGFEVETSQGMIAADKVILATNGYTGSHTPWFRDRIIPIGSYIIATEEIDETIMDRLFPTDRILSDTRRMIFYYRPSPDRKRLLYGGRVSVSETDPHKSGPLLHEDMARIFPELINIKISHSWGGFVGFTFDSLMHAGEQDGLFYAMGYCGSGIAMSSYLGMRIGQQVLGLKEGHTAYNDIEFNGRAYYRGNPWFLTPSLSAFKVMDRMGI